MKYQTLSHTMEDLYSKSRLAFIRTGNTVFLEKMEEATEKYLSGDYPRSESRAFEDLLSDSLMRTGGLGDYE